MRFPHAPGLQVNLLVDSVSLTELENNEEQTESGIVHRYVQSTAGKNFVVEVIIQDDFEFKDSLQCRVYVDGNRLSSRIYRRSERRRAHYISGAESCNEFGEWLEEQFLFTNLQTDDGDIAAAHGTTYKDLGTIKVLFRHVQSLGKDEPWTAPARRDLGSQKIPEKGLKGRAISNRVTLGVSKPVAMRAKISTASPYGPAFATGVFKYGCRRDLQIEGLIPRRPSPPLPLEDCNPDDLSPDEARELVRRLRQQQAQQPVTVKSEAKAEKRDHAKVIDDDGDDSGIEVIASTSKRARIIEESGMEILDLTDERRDWEIQGRTFMFC